MADEDNQRVGSRREFVLLALAIILIGVAMVGFYTVQSSAGRNQEWLDMAKQIQADIGDLAKVGEDATRGVAPDFQLLSGRTEDFSDTVRILIEGDPDVGTRPMPGAVSEEVAAVDQAWKNMRQSVDGVLAGEIAFRRVAGNIAVITDSVPELIRIYEQGATAEQLRQVTRLERIRASALRVLSQGREAQVAAEALDREIKAFQRGGAAASFEPVAAAAAAILQDAEAVGQLQLSAATLQGESTNVLATAKNLEQALIDSLVVYKSLPFISLSAGILALVLLALFIYASFASVRARQKAAEDRDARQQQAILGLLDEITNLADGDLTVDVTVTEDFTGAIADSINYTVGNLRNLVGTINSSAAEIAGSAGTTQGIARNMSEASERQAKEITAVANTITATSQSLQQVAQRAEQLAQQAQGSVVIAHSGAETVGRTIQGMANLREQIQDTSKRIKRLGESSQEIGNIIEFINDISEQTNTLALNASIQAAMAGEAGRGFAVVADEVQRLAERAATATRQIENLVKTIQADTNEAIISMERSTANVVGGAKSAEEAGQALTKIESSSQELAKLITEISASARNQSASATKIAGTMQVIRDIAVQTSGSAGQTAQAVGELTALSDKLRESVSGFKLPGGSEHSFG